jgi:CRISPR system Cascade subunit CasE
MYLSQIPLNTKRRETMQALSSLQLLHGAVEQSFDGIKQRNLWRIDWLDGSCFLLVLSIEKGDFTHIVEQFGYPESEWQWKTRNYSPLLSSLKSGQIWHFRLSANPVRSSFKEKDKESGRGKIFAHVTPEQQKQWLMDRAESCGFILDTDAFDIVHTQWAKFKKGKNNSHMVTLRTATYEGLLTTTDVELFKQSLINGIGRAKAYGCGLLTIANRRGDPDG